MKMKNIDCNNCKKSKVCKYKEILEEKISNIGNEIDSIMEEIPVLSFNISCTQYVEDFTVRKRGYDTNKM